MSNSSKRVYVESSVFIAFIKGEKDQGPNKDKDARLIFDSIIEAAKADLFKIVTSTLTIAEVFKRKGWAELSEKENEDLMPYFREDYLEIIEVDRSIAERANELCRTLPADQKNGYRAMRPNDAIHIASAERAECDVILAWDPQFTSQTERLKTIRLENPDLIIFASPAVQDEMFKGGISEAKQLASAEQLQLVGNIESNQTPAIIEDPSTVQGRNGRRAEGETSQKTGPADEPPEPIGQA